MSFEEAVALSGLFVAFPGVIALGVGVAGVRRHTTPPRGTGWTLLAVVGAAAVGWWVQAVAGTVPADALDRQPPARRASAAAAIEVAAGCGPLARVGELRWSAGESRITFRCDLTILGWPAIHGRAECVDGQWHVRGWREVLGVGACSGRVG